MKDPASYTLTAPRTGKYRLELSGEDPFRVLRLDVGDFQVKAAELYFTRYYLWEPLGDVPAGKRIYLSVEISGKRPYAKWTTPQGVLRQS